MRSIIDYHNFEGKLLVADNALIVVHNLPTVSGHTIEEIPTKSDIIGGNRTYVSSVIARTPKINGDTLFMVACVYVSVSSS